MDSSDAFDRFLKAYPTYQTTRLIDELRAVEYPQLDAGEHIYLDYTGGGLYAQAQLNQHHDLLRSSVLGNPHSSNPTSQAATDLIECSREDVLRFFKADPDEYEVRTSAADRIEKLGVGPSQK